MYLFVHHWKVKPAWLKLGAKERSAYVEQLREGIASSIGDGAELIGFAVGDADAPHGAGYAYFAVWRMAEKNTALEIEQAMEQAGWFGYFEQIGARGEAQTHDAVLQLMAAQPSP